MGMACNKRLLLLIADYDEEERTMLVEYLRPISAKIKETDSGEETIALLQQEPFDCLITDYILPDYDAVALIEDIKKLGVKVPIVVITKNGDEMTAVSVMKAGAHDYIPKSKLSPETLTRGVTSAIRFQKSAEEANFYRDFYDTAPVGFYMTTVEDGTFIKANQQCVKMFGYRTFEQMKADVKTSELYSKERRSELIDLLRTWGQVGRFEIKMILKDGSVKYFLVSAKLCDDFGCDLCSKDQCIRGSIMDITDQRMLELQLDEYKQQQLENIKHLRESIEIRLAEAV